MEHQGPKGTELVHRVKSPKLIDLQYIILMLFFSAERVDNLEIRVGFHENLALCYKQEKWDRKFNCLTFYCHHPLRGRFVSVERRLDSILPHTDNSLSLCEVQVEGKRIEASYKTNSHHHKLNLMDANTKKHVNLCAVARSKSKHAIEIPTKTQTGIVTQLSEVKVIPRNTTGSVWERNLRKLESKIQRLSKATRKLKKKKNRKNSCIGVAVNLMHLINFTMLVYCIF